VGQRYDFDGIFKEMVQIEGPVVIHAVTGGKRVVSFQNVELQTVQQSRVDLVMELEDQSLLHLEFQSNNDPEMAERMVSYHVQLWRKFKRPLRHVVLYVGAAPVTMAARLDTGPMQFSFEVVDIRSFDAGDFLATGQPADCVLAMLAGGGEGRIEQIMDRLRGLPERQMRRAIAQASVLCELRNLSVRVKEEIRTMPVVMDISENAILRDLYEKALEQGKAEGLTQGQRQGRAEGQAEGRAEAAHRLLRVLLEQRFGPLPESVLQHIANAAFEEVEALTIRAASAAALGEVFPGKSA
jgi:predicted transposase YdaD